MNLKWLDHLKDPKEREDFKKYVLNSRPVLDKLSKIVYNMSIERGKVSESDYDSASWAYKQAHKNGFNEALEKIQSLLDLKEK